MIFSDMLYKVFIRTPKSLSEKISMYPLAACLYVAIILSRERITKAWSSLCQFTDHFDTMLRWIWSVIEQ